MKTILTLAFTAAFTLTVHAAPNAPKTTAPTVDSQSFPNYWDAKAWDREGGNSFWTAKSDSKNVTARQSKKATKQANSQRR